MGMRCSNLLLCRHPSREQDMSTESEECKHGSTGKELEAILKMKPVAKGV